MFTHFAILTAHILVSPLLDVKPAPLFCETANPIYVHVKDLQMLKKTKHGVQLLEWIKEHNQKLLNLCGPLPRSFPDNS